MATTVKSPPNWTQVQTIDQGTIWINLDQIVVMSYLGSNTRLHFSSTATVGVPSMDVLGSPEDIFASRGE